MTRNTSFSTAASTRKLPKFETRPADAVIDHRTTAMIARYLALRAAIGDMQLASAVTTAQQAGKQRFASA